MADWSDKRQKVLLAFLLSNRDLLDFLDKVDIQSIYGDYLAECAIILHALRSYRSSFKELPSRYTLFAPLLDDSIRHFDIRDEPEIVSRIHGWTKEIFEEPREAYQEKVKIGIQLAQNFLNDFFVKNRQREILEASRTLGQTRELLLLLAAEVGSLTRSEGPQHIQPFAHPEDYLSGIRVMPTNVDVWDELFGGLRHSETYLILGPTGGGKTLLAIQVGVNVADRGGRVFYATYEQKALIASDPRYPDGPQRSEFLIRGLGALGKLSRTEFEQVTTTQGEDEIKTFDDLPEAMKKTALFYKNSPVAENFNIYDYTTASDYSGTFAALTEDVRRVHEKTPLDLVVIDPVWHMILKTCAVAGIPAEPSRVRSLGQTMAEEISSFVKELQIPIILVHQLGASAASTRNARPTVYGAAEIRTFAWPFENVVAITPMSPNHECGLVRAKSRNSGEMNKLIRAILDGDENQLKLITGGGISGRLEDANQLVTRSIQHKVSMSDSAEGIAEIVLGDTKELETPGG